MPVRVRRVPSPRMHQVHDGGDDWCDGGDDDDGGGGDDDDGGGGDDDDDGDLGVMLPCASWKGKNVAKLSVFDDFHLQARVSLQFRRTDVSSKLTASTFHKSDV